MAKYSGTGLENIVCDRGNLAEFGEGAKDWRSRINRRQFGAVSAAGAAVTLAACAGVDPGAGQGDGALKEDSVTITTADGTMDAFFVRPAKGKHRAVICWPDIASLRDAFMMMARRTAAEGYAVLVVNPYYRDLPAPQFADFPDFISSGGFQKVGPWRAKLTAEAIMRDAKSIVSWLDRQSEVDTKRGIGTEGYCMGGPFTVWSAAAVPARVAGAASFHGGGLAVDSPMSPHALLGTARASFLIGVARNDDAKDPETKVTFKAAAVAAGRAAEVEVYQADHGWTVIDSPVYDKPEAERAYARKLALYGKM